MEKLLQKYQNEMAKIADIKGAAALMQWDQEVYMPVRSNEIRAQQIATLISTAHELLNGDGLKKTINKLLDNIDTESRTYKNMLLVKADIEKQSKLTSSFVKKSSQVTSAAFDVWQIAYRNADFKLFQPHLEEIVKLKRRECKMLGYVHHPYDAMLDEYDKGLTVARTDEIFNELKFRLKGLIHEITKKQAPFNGILSKKFEHESQWELGKKISADLGFNFQNGRKDLSTHPFTVSISSADVRITTRIDEHNFMEMLWSTIHEVGHALYEQGLNKEEYGLPSSEAASISIHESQSRLFENNLGKSPQFLKHYWPLIQQTFSENLEQDDFVEFIKTVNYVEPSFIRTNADELTYHFHVIIRYEIEKALMDGSIEVKELPEMWDYLYDKYLGIKPKNDREGVLQDVHWAHGSFGYFPTYSLGSLYAAQFHHKIAASESNFNQQIELGNFTSIHQWLQENIYQYGRLYSSEELCLMATGESLNPAYFAQYIQAKYNDIYPSEAEKQINQDLKEVV